MKKLYYLTFCLLIGILFFLASCKGSIVELNKVANISSPFTGEDKGEGETSQTTHGLKIQAETPGGNVKYFSAYIIAHDLGCMQIADKQPINSLNSLTIPSLDIGYNRILIITYLDVSNNPVSSISTIFDNYQNEKPVITINSNTTPSANVLEMLMGFKGDFGLIAPLVDRRAIEGVIDQTLKNNPLNVSKAYQIDTDRIARAIMNIEMQGKFCPAFGIGDMNFFTIALGIENPYAISDITPNDIMAKLRDKTLDFNKNPQFYLEDRTGEYRGDYPILYTTTTSPQIISLSKYEAYYKDILRIKGKNFRPVVSVDSRVKFGTVETYYKKVYTEGGFDIMEVEIPSPYTQHNGAITGKVEVTIPGYGKAYSPSEIIICPCQGTSPSSTSNIKIVPDSLLLYQGNTNFLRAYVKDSKGNDIKDAKVKWESLNTDVARVKQDGEVEAVGSGTTKIRASYEGMSSEAEIQVAASDSSIPKPAIPTGLNVTNVTLTSFTLNWNAVTGATGYKVYKDNVWYADVIAPTTSKSITGLTAGTTYSMQVSAVNAGGESTKSTALSVTTASSSSGVKQWTKTLGTASSDMATETAVDTSGGVYVTGYTEGNLDGNTNAGGRDIFLTKYDISGVKQWTKTLGTASSDGASGVAVDSSGGVYVTGYTYGNLDGNTNAGSYDIFLTKYDTSGVKQWTKTLGSASHEEASGLAVDSSGEVYVTGWTSGNLDGNTNAGSWDIFLTKYDTSGVKQ